MEMNLQTLIRFLAKIDDTKGSCWEWTAYKQWNGYGQFVANQENMKAHIVSYRLFKGEIPKGLDLDHLCRNRSCVNPDHLEAVTRSENLKRGLAGYNNAMSKRTHCPQGHPYTLDNLVPSVMKRYGKRSCLICTRKRERERCEKEKAERHKQGRIIGQAQRNKTYCLRGHPLSGDNLTQFGIKRGLRQCRTCVNMRARLQQQKKKELTRHY